MLAGAAQARISGTYEFLGFEARDDVPEDVRPFIGDAEGTRGDKGPWRVVLEVGEPGKVTRIRGGSFRMAATPRGGERDDLRADVESGTIRLVREPGSACANRVYEVRGVLSRVRTRRARSRTATFRAALTEHREVAWGRCRTIAISLRGTVDLPF